MSSTRAIRGNRIGFERIEVELPPTQSIEALIKEAGRPPELLEQMRDGGLRAVPVAPPSPLIDIIGPALRRLLRHCHTSELRGVLLAHSVPVVAPVHDSLLRPLLADLGFPGVPALLVSGQPCAILHTAIRLGAAWLNHLQRGAKIAIIGADRAHSAGERLFFGSAMGDSAVAVLASTVSLRHRVLASHQHTKIRACYGELSPPDSILAFRAENPAMIRATILECLRRSGHSLDEVRFIVPHTPYLRIWDEVARLLGVARGRILTDYIGETGHLNSNDALIHYARAIRDARVRVGDLALLVNPGFGGTRGCTLLRY